MTIAKVLKDAGVRLIGRAQQGQICRWSPPLIGYQDFN
jgi:hypothetical protein